MGNKDLVKLALNTLNCSQKELALRFGVSPTQITKWKKGEHMSQEMEEKLRAILDIGDKDPSFVLWAGSLQEANKWEKLLHFLADSALENAETGYDTYPLHDDLGLLGWYTFDVLRKMGVDIPKKFPEELDGIVCNSGDEEPWDLVEENQYASLIYDIYASLNDVFGFYVAYIDELMNDEELMDTPAVNIEPCLMDLAACKIEVDQGLAPNFRRFRQTVMKDYEEWINIIKENAFRSGTPLRAELMEIVYGHHEKIGHQAEAESLGFNSTQLHPDIYMNELLCGMRAIHQILPAIMKKLGIYEEFKLDTSDFHIG